MKKIILFRLIFWSMLVVIWHYIYPDTIVRMEEDAFFLNTPDYYNFYFRFPKEMLMIAGNYLAQFYIYPWVGAIIQATLFTLPIIGMDFILYTLWGKKEMLCLSFLPAGILVCLYPTSPAEGHLLGWILGTGIVATIFLVIKLFYGKPLIAMRPWKRGNGVYYMVSILLIVASGAWLIRNKPLQDKEQMIRIEHWGQNRQWDKILEATDPRKKQLSEQELRYALLALSEKELLGEYFFQYPVHNSTVFFYDNPAPVYQYRFNGLFFWLLDAPNEAIRYAYQHGQRSQTSMTFEALRNMTERYVEKGDTRQAEYYLNLLSYSTCHDTFISLRRLFLQQRPVHQSVNANFFISTNSLIIESRILLALNPQNRKPIDYMLCGLLAEKELELFYDSFKTYWPEGEKIPTHYQEALLTLSRKYPEVLTNYDISEKKKTEYAEMLTLSNDGTKGREMFKKKYYHSFWGHLLLNSTHVEPATDTNTGASRILPATQTK